MMDLINERLIYRNRLDGSRELNESLKRRAILGLVMLIFFALIAIFVKSGASEPFDIGVQEWFIGIRGPILTASMKFITRMGSGPVIVGLIGVLVLLPKTRKHYGIPVMFTSGFFIVIYKLIKPLFARSRPLISLRLDEADGFSFPSGHSMNSVIFYGMIIFLLMRNSDNEVLKKVAKIGFPILLILIGFSRIYLTVHFTTDVLAGWSFGIFAIMFSSIYMDRTNRRFKR